MAFPLRRLAVLAATGACALLLTGTAWGITVTASMDGGSPNVTWTQPDGYPDDAFVDYIEVASAPDVDAEGFFPLANVVGFTYYADPADSIGRWQASLELQPGATYYVHAEVFILSGPEFTTSWSAAVPFTVPKPTSDTPASPSAPSGPEAPISPVVPIPSGQPPVTVPDYQVRLRRKGSTLRLGFRDRSQPDEMPPAPYKVCWTRPVGMGCTRRVSFDGAWDVVRLRVTRSVGRRQGDKRVVRITWRVGGAIIRQVTLSVRPVS